MHKYDSREGDTAHGEKTRGGGEGGSWLESWNIVLILVISQIKLLFLYFFHYICTFLVLKSSFWAPDVFSRGRSTPATYGWPNYVGNLVKVGDGNEIKTKRNYPNLRLTAADHSDLL